MQKYLHSRLKTIVNADISAFTFENICECRYFCIHARTKICECRYFCIHARPKIYECRYFPIHVWPKFVNADICAFTLGQKILECRYFCIHVWPKFVNADICAFTLGQKILECRYFCIPKSGGKWAKRNADISAFRNRECRNWCICNQYLRNCLNVNADNSAFT